jgi:hypothetical protein
MFLEIYQQYKIFIWLGIIIIVFALILFVLYRLLVFQVISTNPSNKSEISAGATTITITYNKNIQVKNSTDQVLASARIIKSTEVQGNKLIINLINLDQNVDYELYIKDITSNTGDTIPLYVFKFHNKYIPFNEQSREMQEQAIKTTDKGNIDDAAVKALPKTSDTFSITYVLSGEPIYKGKLIKLRIALLVTNFELNDKAKIALYKKQALDYLRSQGVNPNDYVIDYYPAEAANL